MLELRNSVTRDPAEIIIGDFVQKIDEFSNVSGELIEVTAFNVDKISNLSHNNRVAAIIPLIGYETPTQTGIPGEIIENVCDEFKIRRDMFRISGKDELSSSGNYRSVRFSPIDFTRSGNWISFALGKGIYATSMIEQLFGEIKN
ncbi:tRNA pseudouridine synthase D [mine drainage metagenome]|uniref:tRNA pseudouridine synthase D n=1 Tax=mine drainage metagenome TaxID=410659 RepID=T0XYZ7_9ZZZZ